ncbi:alkaline phosphatase [Brevundimonas sp.]|uniref:alkaline phosphatase n=1 Tax=Brevundimonas sp. TaxID=1871086 RepID=UPI003D13B916
MKPFLPILLGAALSFPPIQAQAQVQADIAALDAATALRPDTGRPKNVILMIGDGMGINSVTAGRIYEGQALGEDGASHRLSFDRFPYTALSRTYSADRFVTDSANGASALMTGYKTINGAIGVDDQVRARDCASATAARVPTLSELARAKGLAIGVVTTAPITDATPAATYAHTPFRGWQSDIDMPAQAVAQGCIDIARQLVEGEATPEVVLGAGLAYLKPEADGGRRKDGRDLVEAWRRRGGASTVVSDLPGLTASTTPRLMGLFSNGALPADADRAPDSATPRLPDMTAAAIRALSQNPEGYLLVVEGAQIDSYHHANDPRRALAAVAEFSQAVDAARRLTDPADTLIIVTADHSHSLVLTAGSDRKAPLLGLAGANGAPNKALDDAPYPTLIYGTGPSPTRPQAVARADESSDADALRSVAVPLSSAGHAGEDVPVYADGPQAYLVRGVIEPTYVFQLIRRALSL